MQPVTMLRGVGCECSCWCRNEDVMKVEPMMSHHGWRVENGLMLYQLWAPPPALYCD